MKIDKTLGGSNVINLLKTFSKDDQKDFEKFVQSPYFNKGRNYIQLLKIINKFAPDFDSDKFTKNHVYGKLFPGKVYKESVMKSMLSRLDAIAEEFLYQKAVENYDFMLRERLLLNEFSKRGLRKRAEKVIKETEKLISGKKAGVLDFVKMKDYTNEVLNHYYNFNERSKYTDYLFIHQLYNVYAFLTEFLLNEGSVYAQRNFWSKELDINSIMNIFESIDSGKILSQVKKYGKDEYNILKLLYLLMMSLKHPGEDKYFFDLKRLFTDISDSFDLDFKKYILNAMTIVCSTKSVAGKEEFRKEAFIIRKKIYDENLNIFSGKHYLKNGDFRTAFIEAVNLNEIKWAEEFLEKYLFNLQPEYREDISNYCKAVLSYGKGNYDEALLYSNMVNIKQITYKLDLKNLVSKIYFETGSTENLISLLNAYYQLINNSNSQNKNFLSRHLNFIKYLRQLLNFKLNNAGDTDLKLLYDSVKRDNVTSKKWLLEKAGDLI
ncbi:MAG TPA: hypothetical protein PK536_10070 [Ignavibacteria bacterium]|nr:hypothetical protein [Ignavibacteria bacterium]HRJ99413.1 hypothetical protein [Ignavibacteria bacterium]